MVFRFASGLKESFRFAQEALVESLYDFVWVREPRSFWLTDSATKQPLADVTVPLWVLAEGGAMMVFVNCRT